MKPRILVDPDLLSEHSLHLMDKTVENYKKGNVSKPADLQKYLKIAEEIDEI